MIGLSEKFAILKAPKPLSVSLLLNNCSLCPFQFVGSFCHEHYFDILKKPFLGFSSLKRSCVNSWVSLHILTKLVRGSYIFLKIKNLQIYQVWQINKIFIIITPIF